MNALALVDGVCYGIPSGEVLIELVVGACGGYGIGDNHAGSGASRQFRVMELIAQSHQTGKLT